MNVTRVTVSAQAEAVLRNQILSRDLLPGQVLTEDASAQLLGVSRPTVRQAFATLESEGLVTRNPGNRILQVTSLSTDDIAAIYRARKVLELAGVDAAQTIAEPRFEALWRALAQIEHAVRKNDARLQVEADLLMHQVIVSFLDSPDLTTLETQLLTRLRLAIVTDRKGNPRAEMMERDNRLLCELLTARRVDEARSVLTRRLDEAERSIIASMELSRSSLATAIEGPTPI